MHPESFETDRVTQPKSSIQSLFDIQSGSVSAIRKTAAEAEFLIDSISPFIESLTTIVCPDCTNVCCINRHSLFDYSDVIFMTALNREIPENDPEVADSAPCRFLGAGGCVRKRSERPYRCTWYFCSPLLEVIEEQLPTQTHRFFIKNLQKIREKRMQMITDFETFTSLLALSSAQPSRFP